MARILIVEDEEFLTQALKDNLEAESFEVDVASNADDAIRLIQTNLPDLILLDIVMPRKDGFSVLGAVKKNFEWKAIPVVILSNLGGEDDVQRAMTMGADGYFIKSQHPMREVIETVKQYLKKSS